MTDLVAIGSSGISAYQRALATVSNNIANVNTDGYTRQDVAIASNQPIQKGVSYIGSGARFDAVRRQFDAFIESNLRNSNSDLQAQEPLLSYVNRLIDIMGDQSIGLTTAMNQFFESARSVAADPASTIARSVFLRDADGLAARYRELSSQVGLLQSETQQSVETDIGQINSYTTQLAQINKQLTKHSEEAKQPSELLDQRDLLLRKLSGLVSISTTFAPNGAVLVSVGDTIDQGILVSGVNARQLSVRQSEAEPNKLEFILDAYGDQEGVPAFSSGKISGTLQFRDQVLNPALDALDGLVTVTVESINTVHQNGLDSEGKLGGALFGFAPGQENTASGVQLLIRDASRVASAGQFRVIDNPINSSLAEATISYQSPVYEGPSALLGDLAWAKSPGFASIEDLAIPSSTGFTSLGLVPFGMTDLTLTMTDPSITQSFQVLTRDGRHLAGKAITESQKTLMLKPSQGMEAGATYDSRIRNQRGLISISYETSTSSLNTGAMVLSISDDSGVFKTPLSISVAEGDDTPQGLVNAINTSDTAKSAGVTASLNQDNSISITGPLGSALALSATDSDSEAVNLNFSRSRVYDAYLGTDVFIGAKAGPTQVQQFNIADGSVLDPTIAPAQLVGTSFGSTNWGVVKAGAFQLNGISLPSLSSEGGQISLDDVIKWINDASENHSMGIDASDSDGRLMLTATDNTTEIRLGIGSGTGADLKNLGFDTSLYVSGAAADDLLIYVTDTSNTNTTVSISGQYLEINGDMKQALRESQLQVTFVTDTQYEIRDLETNTVVAQRTLDVSTPTPSLSYRGLQLQFSNSPLAGDVFRIDGNQDGIGNNEVMLQLVALEDAEIMPGGLTLTEAYIERTNMVGNVARQAAISQQALQVVYQQALETRDGISGVNLDQEASALVRFQQAYQANAKVMQIASTLFDSILQVR